MSVATTVRRSTAEAGGHTSAVWHARRPIFLIAEDVDQIPDEGYRNFARELAGALAARAPIRTYTAGGDAMCGMQRLSSSPLLVGLALWRELRAHRPVAVIYLARSAATLAGVVRARLLKAVAGHAVVCMIALQPRRYSALGRLIVRFCWPDLVLVGSASQQRYIRGLGAPVASLPSGVDLHRFRPPGLGEKEALRQKWSLPTHTRVILHVGHLMDGRNLQALRPLAARPGFSVLVLASSRSGPTGLTLKTQLAGHGIRVLDGFQPAVEELYRLADCYVFPVVSSDHAIAMPLSVLEALASDLPVVSTRFGALIERFANRAGLWFAEAGEELLPIVESALQTRSSTRHLAEPYGWDVVGDSLLSLLMSCPQPPGVLRSVARLARVLPAAVRRRLWWGEDAVRRVVFKRAGFARRPYQTGAVTRAASLGPSGSELSRAATARDVVGVITSPVVDGERSAPAESARFYGLAVESAQEAEAAPLVERALSERWPLLGFSLEGSRGVPQIPLQHLHRFIAEGGTLMLSGINPGSNAVLAGIGDALGVTLPECRALRAPAGALRFHEHTAGFAHEFAGSRIEGSLATSYLAGGDRARVLASCAGAGADYPCVVEIPIGGGRLVLSAGPERLRSPLADALGPRHALAVLPPMMLVRQLYGEAAWHPPAALGNFTVDDPALRNGLLGLDYRRALALARDHDVHLSIATVPRDLKLATRDVVEVLQRNRRHLSACYHGTNHSGYEFFLPDTRRTRFPRRPLAGQERSLRRAVVYAERLAARTGYRLDRVMVFPHGIGPVAVLPTLDALGFLATCNAFDRYPLGASIPDDFDLGTRPADVAWAGFPLIWRRPLRDRTFAFDLFAGRPAITYAHRNALGRDLLPFAERAEEVYGFTRGRVRWCSLEEIARHCYLQRLDPRSGWQVSMLANEICLHNPDSGTRVYRVHRPHRPVGTSLAVDGPPADGRDSLDVAVPPHGQMWVRLSHPGREPVKSGPCSLQDRTGQP